MIFDYKLKTVHKDFRKLSDVLDKQAIKKENSITKISNLEKNS